MNCLCVYLMFSFFTIFPPIFANGQVKYNPQNLCVRLTTNTTAVVQWFEPVTLRDEIMGYTIYYTRDSELPLEDWNFTSTGNYPLSTVRNIELGETYSFRIRLHALNMEGPGPISDSYHVKMVNRTRSCYDHQTTSSIRSLNILRAAATSYMSVEVWWNVPYDPDQHTGFCVTYGINNSHFWQNVTVGLVQNVELTNLQQSAVYTITLALITESGLDHFVQDVTVKVQPEEIPLDFMVYDINATSMALQWKPPTRFNPIQYRITYDASKEYVDALGSTQTLKIPKTEHVVDGHITELHIKDLSPNTNYNVNVTAIPVDRSYRPPSKTTVKTEVAPPSSLAKPNIYKTAKAGTIQVLLPKASEEFGRVAHYYVVVVPQNEMDDVPTKTYSLEEMQDGVNNEGVAYIAAKFARKIPYAFLLGNGEQYEGFTNRKLKGEAKYKMFVRAVVDAPLEELYTDSPYSDVFYLDMPEIKSKTQNGL